MIRFATKNDISGIIHLATNLNDNFKSTYDIENYVDNDKYIVLVNEDRFINGFLLAYNNIDELELLCIIVEENHRNKGIGTNLIKKLIATSDNKPIILEVSDKNKNAINLYEKLNFKNIAIRKNYYKDSDAIIMKR